jgi:hypothetical protein
VSQTVQKGILQVNVYEGAEMELMLGMFAVLSKWHVAECNRKTNVLIMNVFNVFKSREMVCYILVI